MNDLKVFYTWDDNLIKHTDRLPAVLGRASIVHELITAYGLLKHMKIVRSSPAVYENLREFHSDLYLDHLKTFNEVDEEYISCAQDEEYGIGYDCPPVSNMFELVASIAGGSITAAKCLLLGVADVAINWCGGWHHGHRFGAEGFCYVNDIVLAIETLKRKFDRVLYIDLDVHHGNGVQDAYNLSDSVFTLSFHKYEPGFYPGTGALEDIGTLSGKGYSCNVPLHASYSDVTLVYMFERLFPVIYSLFAPDAVVVQCGADALAHDPHGGASLTLQGYSTCVRSVLDKRKPTILLGGGGYKHENAARLWTSLTAQVVGVTLDENIPEHSQWPIYRPNYTLALDTALARDTNTRHYLDNCCDTIKGNLEKFLCHKSIMASDKPVTKIIEVKTKHMERKMKRESTEINVTQDATTIGNNLDQSISKENNRIFKRFVTNCTQKPKLEENNDVYAFTDD